MAKSNGGFKLNATECDVDEEAISRIEGAMEDDPDDDISVVKPMPYVPLKIPPEQKEKIMGDYTCAIVQDFFDEYSMTEEEKAAAFEFYNLFKILDTVKSKTENLATFVEYYRKTMTCLYAVADDNGVYPRDKFISLVLKGKIKVSGLRFPRFSGNRKKVNWERIMEYVLDTSLDPKDLAKVRDDFRYDTPPDIMYKIISERFYGGDIEGALAKAESETVPTDRVFDPDTDKVMGRNVVVPVDRKDSRKYMKRYGCTMGILDGIKEYGKSTHTRDQLADYVFQMRQDDFEKIERMNAERDGDSTTIPVFKGDLFDSDDYNLYMHALEEYELHHTFVEYDNKIMTVAEYEELALKNVLDESGWNVREMYDYREREKRAARREAMQEKEKRRLKRKLAKIGRMGSGVNTKKKKRHKSHKADSVKGKLDSAVGQILAGNYQDFDSYTDAMERFGDDDE